MAEGRGFLGNIPWWGQLLIVVVLVVGVAYLVDLLMFADIRVQTKKDTDEAAKLAEENRQSERFRSQLADYKKAYDQALEELKVYRERIPEEVQISDTLANLQRIAQESSAVIRIFRPKPAQPKDFYKEKPVEVAVGTTYANLGKFFENLANFKRIVRVSDVDIKKATSQTSRLTIESAFTVTTFFASEADILSMPQETGAKK